MPVMPRNFCFQMVASLSKSVECESLSLFVGRASSATLCTVAEHGGLEHYTVSNVGHYVILFSQWVNLPNATSIDFASPCGGNDW